MEFPGIILEPTMSFEYLKIFWTKKNNIDFIGLTMSATMNMETNIQSSKKSDPIKSTEILKPDQPISNFK